MGEGIQQHEGIVRCENDRIEFVLSLVTSEGTHWPLECYSYRDRPTQ